MALSDIVVATIINWVMAPLLALMTSLRDLLAPGDVAVEYPPRAAMAAGVSLAALARYIWIIPGGAPRIALKPGMRYPKNLWGQ